MTQIDGEIYHVHWLEESIEWTEYTRQSNLLIHCNPYQVINGIFIELEQIISQFVWKYKKPRIAKAILKKKNGTGRINLPEIRPYDKAIVIKTVWYWHKDRNIEQWNKIERDKSMHLWRRKWQPTPELLPGKSHGWRSLVSCSPRGP